MSTILLVDDDVDFLMQMQIQLEAAGYEVWTAGGLDEADEVLSAHRPDLAVLDLMMDNMDDGFVLAHRIKKLDQTIPVIIVTAVTSETGMEFAADAREERTWVKADAVLNKPVRFEQLRAQIDKLLGPRT